MMERADERCSNVEKVRAAELFKLLERQRKIVEKLRAIKRASMNGPSVSECSYGSIEAMPCSYLFVVAGVVVNIFLKIFVLNQHDI
jgi:hypothetical protein